MPITYRYDENTRVVHTRVKGILTSAEIVEHLSAIYADDQVNMRYEIVDLNDISDFEMKYSEFLKVVRLASKLIENGHEGMAFCAYRRKPQAIIRLMLSAFSSLAFSLHVCTSPEEYESIYQLASGLDETVV